MSKCKQCKESDQLLEASGLCFTCAEELAVLLADEGFDPSAAWGN